MLNAWSPSPHKHLWAGGLRFWPFGPSSEVNNLKWLCNMLVTSNSLIFGTHFWSTVVVSVVSQVKATDLTLLLTPDPYTPNNFATSSVHLILRWMSLHCRPVHEFHFPLFVYSGVPLVRLRMIHDRSQPPTQTDPTHSHLLLSLRLACEMVRNLRHRLFWRVWTWEVWFALGRRILDVCWKAKLQYGQSHDNYKIVACLLTNIHNVSDC